MEVVEKEEKFVYVNSQIIRVSCKGNSNFKKEEHFNIFSNFQIDYFELDQSDTLDIKTSKRGHKSSKSKSHLINIKKWTNSSSLPLLDLFEQFHLEKSSSTLIHWDFKVLHHWKDGLYYPTLIFVLENFEILIFKLPNHFSELEWTCQCYINYQIARHMNELSIISLQKNQPKKYFQFNIFDGPLIQLSSLLSQNSSSVSSISNIPFSYFIYDSFPILEVLFPCHFIQATPIHEDAIEFQFYSNYTEKKYFWIRKNDQESDKEPDEEPALSSESIIKLYSEHYDSPYSSFIYPMSDISFVVKDYQETTILGTRKKTCLWIDSNFNIRQNLLLPHIPIELKIIPIEANRNVYHVKLINKVDCLVFGDNSIKTFESPILYQQPYQNLDTTDHSYGNIIEIVESDTNYLFTNVNDILVYDNTIPENSHINDDEAMDTDTSDTSNNDMEKTINTILNILNDYILDIDHSSRNLKNQLDKKVILINHNKHLLKDLTDQINFQRPVKRLRTNVSQFLFNPNYSKNSIGKEGTDRINLNILNSLDDYDEDDSQWLKLLSHSTTYSENYFYSTIRIKNTSKYILENIVLNPVFILSDIFKKEIKEKKKRITMDFPIVHVSMPIHLLLPESEVDLSLFFRTSLFYSELKLNLAVQFLCKGDYIYTIRSSSIGTLTYSSLSYQMKDDVNIEEVNMKDRKRKRIVESEDDEAFNFSNHLMKKNSQVIIGFLNPNNINNKRNKYYENSFHIDDPSLSTQKIVKFSEKNDKVLLTSLLDYFQNNYSMSSEFFNHQALDYLLKYKLKSISEKNIYELYMENHPSTSSPIIETTNSIQKNILNTKKLLLSTMDNLRELNKSRQVIALDGSFIQQNQNQDQDQYNIDDTNPFLKKIKVYNAVDLKNEIQYRFIKRLKRYFSDLIKCMDFLHHPEEVPISTPTSVAYLFQNTDKSAKGKEKETSTTSNIINENLLKSPNKYVSKSTSNHNTVTNDTSFISSSPPFLFLSPLSPNRIKLIKKANQQQQKENTRKGKGKEVMVEEEPSGIYSSAKKEIDLTFSFENPDQKILDQEKANISTLNSSSSFFSSLSSFNYLINRNPNVDLSDRIYLSSRSVLSTLISRIKLNDERLTVDSETKEALQLFSPPTQSNSNFYSKEKHLETIHDIYKLLKNYSPLINVLETSLQSDRSYIDAILSLCLL